MQVFKSTAASLTAALAVLVLAPGAGPRTAAASLHPALVDAGLEAETLASLTPEAAQVLRARASDSGVPGETIDAWVSGLNRLSEEDLPVAPVLSRYLQGLSKGIPASRIDAAVSDLESRLRQAAARIDAVYPRPEDPADKEARLIAIDHGAYALGVGITEGDLTHSIRLVNEVDLPLTSVEAPVLTLGILASAGLSPAQSLEVVDAAWTHGYRGETLERLGKSLGTLGNDGHAPSGEIVQQVLKMIGADTSQEAVFRGLDELMGRDGYRLSSASPGEDPTIRRGDTGRDDLPTEPPHKDNNQTRRFHDSDN